jgi:hypothetical protein
VTTAYAVITTTDEKPRDIVVTDDFDIKRTQPASNSKKIIAETDVLRVCLVGLWKKLLWVVSCGKSCCRL